MTRFLDQLDHSWRRRCRWNTSEGRTLARRQSAENHRAKGGWKGKVGRDWDKVNINGKNGKKSVNVRGHLMGWGRMGTVAGKQQGHRKGNA